MRLLHAKTEKLHEFFDGEVPPYAILSHTWQDDEVKFRDINPGYCPWHTPGTDEEVAAHLRGFETRYRAKSGYRKIEGCCRRALEDGFEWVWVDTCCIDGSSSSELQEAINSMYSWYEGSNVCYAYLVDVPPGQDAHSPDSAFRKSRWFTRGWTLQELLAPKVLQFFDQQWNLIADKSDLTQVIACRTGISQRYLSQSGRIFVRLASVAERMSWASGRETRRTEDVAYCLLGIFGINMPMLYGEGPRAFGRLQEEIMRKSRDQSLIASGYRLPRPSVEETHSGRARWTVWTALANSPAQYLHASDARQRAPQRSTDAFYMTQRGMRINLPVCQTSPDQHERYEYCILNCGISTGPYKETYRLIAIPLISLNSDDHKDGGAYDKDYVRMEMQIPIFVPKRVWEKAPSKAFYIRQTHASRNLLDLGKALAIGNVVLPPDFFLAGIYPPQSHPFTALELGTVRAGTGARAMMHIARRDDLKHGVLVIVSTETQPSIDGRFLDPAQKPGIAAVHVPADFCVIDALDEVRRLQDPVSLEGQPIELSSVRLDPSSGASGVVMIELLRDRGKNLLDIELVENPSTT